MGRFASPAIHLILCLVVSGSLKSSLAAQEETRSMMAPISTEAFYTMTQFFQTVNEAQQVFDLIDSETKKIIFYDRGHGFSTEYIEPTVAWFRLHLQ